MKYQGESTFQNVKFTSHSLLSPGYINIRRDKTHMVLLNSGRLDCVVNLPSNLLIFLKRIKMTQLSGTSQIPTRVFS